MAGIVCKIWNVSSGTKNKGPSGQLSDSIEYIANEEKTSVPLDIDTQGQIDRSINYAANDIKTMHGALVGTRNLISSDTTGAVSEMMDVKAFFRKTEDRAALHGVISLEEEESSPSNVSELMQLCEDVLEELFPDNQAVFAVHTNTENLHVHFIVNSVSLKGEKIHQPRNFIREILQPAVNRAAVNHNFTPNDKWERYHHDKITDFVRIKMDLRDEIDRAIEMSDTFEQFTGILESHGMTVNVGKYISLQNDGMDKAMRTKNLGPNYTKEAIINRIATRREAFESITRVSSHVIKDDLTSIGTVLDKKPFEPMKKYSEMDKQERKQVVTALKAGRNPWREYYTSNWVHNDIADQLNRTHFARELISRYTDDGSVQSALDALIRAKEAVLAERKKVKEEQKSYAPVLKIYNRMNELASKAYLYDVSGISGYKKEYEEYMECVYRLKDGYDKTPEDVKAYADEIENQLIYANTQLAEISQEYRDIKAYGLARGEQLAVSQNLYDALNYWDTKQELKRESHMGYFASETYNIVSSDCPDVILRVDKMPDVKNGQIVEALKVTIMSTYGEILGSSSSLDSADFSHFLKEISNTYGFKDCHRYNRLSDAVTFCQTTDTGIMEKKTEQAAPISTAKSPDGGKILSFIKGLNACTDGDRYLVNVKNPLYTGLCQMQNDCLYITVMDRNGTVMEKAGFPTVQNKTSEGYKQICELQEKYGFGDVYTFQSEDEAEAYMKQLEERTTSEKEKEPEITKIL